MELYCCDGIYTHTHTHTHTHARTLMLKFAFQNTQIESLLRSMSAQLWGRCQNTHCERIRLNPARLYADALNLLLCLTSYYALTYVHHAFEFPPTYSPSIHSPDLDTDLEDMSFICLIPTNISVPFGRDTKRGPLTVALRCPNAKPWLRWSLCQGGPSN